jgi:hypothetical protein
LPLLHEAISCGLAEVTDDIQASGALQLGDGWMHIHGERQQQPILPKCRTLTFIYVAPPDDRNLPPLNRIGDPDDIIASVRVQGGKVRLFFCNPSFSFPGWLKRPPARAVQILAETYQAMPSYRVCTAHGITQLTEGLASKLRSLLDARAREESLGKAR